MKKTILSFVLVLAILFHSSCSLFEKHIFTTDDISNYNLGEYRWFGVVFSENTALPEQAEVIDYYYYRCYEEARDEYLELRFQTAEQTMDYLTSLLDEIKINLSDRIMPKDGEWFYEEQNPYNASYNDVFCFYHNKYKPALGEKPYYSGYSVIIDDDKTIIDAFCGIISYSIEEKTVIQTFFDEYYSNYSSGFFVPKYFSRFNISVNQNHDRYFYFN